MAPVGLGYGRFSRKGWRQCLANYPRVFYIFSLRCADGSHYTGISSNIAERLNSTNDGRGPQATRDQLPVTLAFSIGPFPDHAAARVVSTWILPEASDRYQLLLRGDGAPVGRFGVVVKFGQEALEEALTNQQESLSWGRAPARFKLAPSKEWVDTAGVTLDLALADPAQLARFLVDFAGPRDGDIILRRLLTDESLRSIGERHGRSPERVRQVLAKFGVRLRSAFGQSELATQLHQECRKLDGKVSPWDLAPAVQRVLGWRPERVSLALLVALIGVADPDIEFTNKLKGALEQAGPGRPGEKSVELTDDDALELVRQLAGGPEPERNSSKP